MNNKNTKIKKLRIFYIDILLNQFLQGLDKSLDDLGWIFIQNILEKQRREHQVQIHGFLFNKNRLKIIASFIKPNENYFLASLEKNLCSESHNFPPEPLTNFIDYQSRLIQLFVEAQNSDYSLENNPRCSFYYLTKGKASLIKIEDHLNLGLNLKIILDLVREFKLKPSAKPIQNQYRT